MCGESRTKKYGRRNGRQQYFCKSCSHKFQSKRRLKNGLWKIYANEKQTQAEIADKIGVSRWWVNKQLAKLPVFSILTNQKLKPQPTVLILDTTYFEQFGLMLFRSADLRKNLLCFIVEHETNDLYKKGIQMLIDDGWVIQAIVADGKPGIKKLFPEIPFQLCQFHQFAAVTRYISKKPKLPASRELRKLMFLLKETDEASFTYWLNEWHVKWKDFLDEQTIHPLTKRKTCTHERLRKAYRSLKQNLSLLFAFERHFREFNIPKTTNSIDGYFGHLKNKLGVHRGASKSTQVKLIGKLIFE